MNDCIFCKILKGEIPSKKVYEDDKVVAIMDVNPKVDGHTLVIPKKHVNDFTELSDEDVLDIFKVAKYLGPKMMNKLGARALTCGINYGDSQAVKHVHLHLLPDYTIKEKSDRDLDEIYEIIKED
jgi:histidine triad (HIT) family protein